MDTRYRSRTKIDTNVDVAMTPTGAWVGFKLPNIFFHVQDMKNKRKNLFLLHILFWDQVKHKSILVSLQYITDVGQNFGSVLDFGRSPRFEFSFSACVLKFWLHEKEYTINPYNKTFIFSTIFFYFINSINYGNSNFIFILWYKLYNKRQ